MTLETQATSPCVIYLSGDRGPSLGFLGSGFTAESISPPGSSGRPTPIINAGVGGVQAVTGREEGPGPGARAWAHLRHPC